MPFALMVTLKTTRTWHILQRLSLLLVQAGLLCSHAFHVLPGLPKAQINLDFVDKLKYHLYSQNIYYLQNTFLRFPSLFYPLKPWVGGGRCKPPPPFTQNIYLGNPYLKILGFQNCLLRMLLLKKKKKKKNTPSHRAIWKVKKSENRL